MKRALAGALLVGGVVTLGAPPAHAEPTAVTACEGQMIVHRGGAPDRHTENSWGRLRATYRSGLTQFEVDVHTAADHSLWVNHDNHLRRTAGKDRRISKLTWSGLHRMRLRDGSRMPSVAQLLTWAAKRDLEPTLHIKRMTPRSWRGMAALVRSRGLQGQVSFLGFEADMLRAEQLLPGTDTTVHSPRPGYGPMPLDRIAPFDAVAVVVDLIEEEYVGQVRAAGKRFLAFTPEREEQWAELRSWGVDSMLVNRTEGFRSYCASLG